MAAALRPQVLLASFYDRSVIAEPLDRLRGFADVRDVNFGRCLTEEELDESLAGMHVSIAADEKYINPYDPLMRIALGQRRWEDAERLSQTALRLNPIFPEAQYCLAVASYKQGKLDPAREAALALQSSAGADRFPESLQLLGTLLGKAGQFEKAAAYFREYLDVRPDSPSAEEIERFLVEWEALGVIQPPPDSTARPE